MKKNVMMRIASVLLIAVLLTTSAVSGTYAKYVTSGTGTDSARVAKWGVTVTADFSDLFTERYDTHVNWNGDTDGDSVVSSEVNTDVVAPGTDGTLANFTVNGQPEVDVNVSYKAELTLSNWYADTDNDGMYDDEYCPIVIIVNGTSYSAETISDLETKVEEAITNAAANYNAGTGLSDVVPDDLNVSWKWHFVGGAEGGTGPDFQKDEFDTDLGNYAKHENNPPTISLTVTCTVTQVD